MQLRNILIILIVFFGISCDRNNKKGSQSKEMIIKSNVIYLDTPEKTFTNAYNFKLFKESEELHYKGNYEGSLKILLKLEKEENKNKLVLGSLGIVYMDLKEYEVSEKYLKRAIGVDSKFVNNWFNLATLYQRRNMN